MLRWLRELFRLMCGVPDYDRYVAHLRHRHPDRAIPTYEEFFDMHQRARFAKGRARCC